MDIWFLADMQRLHLERNAIRCLQERADWLAGVDWTLEGELCVEAVLRVHEHEYQVRMTYPPLFPSVPPIVRPKNRNERWSTHQYVDGTLCLQWGPDTWHPDVTGAQVLESAYDLLFIENPRDAEEQVAAPSRHHLSQGQALRGSFGRLHVPSELETCLRNLPRKCTGSLEFSVQLQSHSFLVLVHQVRPIGGQEWLDTSIPASLKASAIGEGSTRLGVFYKTYLDPGRLGAIDSIGRLGEALYANGYEHLLVNGDAERFVMDLTQPLSGVLLVDSADVPHFWLLLDPKTDRAFYAAPVRSQPCQRASRIPIDVQRLSVKSVGILGVGSVGSRVAVSLARSGVAAFYLVDHDIFLPENACRHVLDWRNVGEHKVDAVAELLSFIAADIRVEVSHLNVTGQESTASLSGVLNRLGHCDLIIDATAEPQVFNLAAHVSTIYDRPLVWAEVYAGGIGGLISRSRPGLDPDPFTMRAAYNQFASETPAPDLSGREDYTAEDANGKVVSASDADVGIMAAHATRLAIDTLLGSEPSAFPYSMYLIGLAESWIFKAPFHTIPIATDHLLRGGRSTGATPHDVLADSVAFVSSLLEKSGREDPTS